MLGLQSARCISGYVYASSGVYETTTDTIFGGDLIISEYGKTLKRGKRFELDSSYIYADIDLEKLNYLRLGETSFSDEPIADFRDIEIANLPRVQNIEVNIFKDYLLVPSLLKVIRRLEGLVERRINQLFQGLLLLNLGRNWEGGQGRLKGLVNWGVIPWVGIKNFRILRNSFFQTQLRSIFN